jgi:hypothetical protein
MVPRALTKELVMSKVTKNQASQVVSLDGFEGRYEEVEDYTIGFESYSRDFDAAPLFRGLPEDRCQCPHWGVVLKGKVGFRTSEGEETIEAGEAYYVQPGHTPIAYAGTEVIEFSPTEQLNKTVEVVMRNMQGEQVG